MNKGIYFLGLIAIILMLALAGYFLFFSSTSTQVAQEPSSTQLPVVQNESGVAPAATDTPEPLLEPAQPDPTVTPTLEQSLPTMMPITPTPTEIALSEMILITAGEFVQGTDDAASKEGPSQLVSLSAYEIDKFEVTNSDFAQFVASTGYLTDAEKSSSQGWRQYGEGKPKHPVVKVTWNDAVAFCTWAGKRLPNEAEWEKAARGTDARIYPWGNAFDARLANVKDTLLRRTAPVGEFSAGASPYGVQDMSGNVWEWTASWFLPYPGNTEPNPYFGEQFRVTRGGAWFEEANQVTTYNRNAADPDITANDDVGFRCARDIN